MLVTRYRPRRPMYDMRRNLDLFNAMLNSMEMNDKNRESTYDFTPSVNTREGKYA
ncbi:MAG TPA: Hsp20/alpha crystallin family protein, partial [Epsilonproteobacteria bacterium]|nr:Hsp20/alpha crystallin family protein [Campylobacterota bacterium]